LNVKLVGASRKQQALKG